MITKKQADVLSHTRRTGRYVTVEEEVVEMVKAGLLRNHGVIPWTNGYSHFTLTETGRKALEDYEATLPKPKPLTRSQRRYREWADSLSELTFIDWLRQRYCKS